MVKEKIILIGGGGHCHSVIDVIEQENRFEIVGIVDKKEMIGQKVMAYDVIGSDDDLEEIFKSCQNALITIGQIETSTIRKKIYQKLKTIGFNLPVIISPIAYVSKHSKVGEGTVLMHQVLVNSNVFIGKNCIINTKALIEHDAIIGDNCHISTASVINGGVKVNDESFFGSNSTSKQNIELSGFIKAGSVVK